MSLTCKDKHPLARLWDPHAHPCHFDDPRRLLIHGEGRGGSLLQRRSETIRIMLEHLCKCPRQWVENPYLCIVRCVSGILLQEYPPILCNGNIIPHGRVVAHAAFHKKIDDTARIRVCDVVKGKPPKTGPANLCSQAQSRRVQLIRCDKVKLPCIQRIPSTILGPRESRSAGRVQVKAGAILDVRHARGWISDLQ